MSEPNPDDPLIAEIAHEFKHNHPLFVQNAKKSTAQHAFDKSTSFKLDEKGSETQPEESPSSTGTLKQGVDQDTTAVKPSTLEAVDSHSSQTVTNENSAQSARAKIPRAVRPKTKANPVDASVSGEKVSTLTSEDTVKSEPSNPVTTPKLSMNAKKPAKRLNLGSRKSSDVKRTKSER
ncbi:hypothetical protein HK104_004733 [Borealophlyctis nickersoniae]|nr:hypothetical protein HK104_004733 [Borealophlyctis nickersoniae]